MISLWTRWSDHGFYDNSHEHVSFFLHVFAPTCDNVADPEKKRPAFLIFNGKLNLQWPSFDLLRNVVQGWIVLALSRSKEGRQNFKFATKEFKCCPLIGSLLSPDRQYKLESELRDLSWIIPSESVKERRAGGVSSMKSMISMKSNLVRYEGPAMALDFAQNYFYCILTNSVFFYQCNNHYIFVISFFNHPLVEKTVTSIMMNLRFSQCQDTLTSTSMLSFKLKLSLHFTRGSLCLLSILFIIIHWKVIFDHTCQRWSVLELFFVWCLFKQWYIVSMYISTFLNKGISTFEIGF